MNHTHLVRRLQSVSHVNGNLDCVINGQATATQSLIERFAFDEFQNERYC